ncbi:MAG: hypothetical protein FWD66_10355 [Paludibacter sp.]|nr:hypothetical protein [Paludibacter sp.]
MPQIIMNVTDLIHDIFTSPFGSSGFIVAIVLIIVWLVFFITKKTTEIRSEHGVLTNHLKETENRIEKRMDNIDTKIDDIRRDFSYVRGSIDINLQNNFAKRKSPIALTQAGIEMSNELKAKETVERNWSKIFADLEENIYTSEKNPYDIQEYIRKIAAVEPEKFFSDDDLLGMKNFAFKQGQSLMYYSIIYAIIIRDKYLSEKGINVSEIDKHDPHKHKDSD